jgi:hypothetical protein
MEKLSEEELGFGEPTYHLESIAKDVDSKYIKIIWQSSV